MTEVGQYQKAEAIPEGQDSGEGKTWSHEAFFPLHDLEMSMVDEIFGPPYGLKNLLSEMRGKSMPYGGNETFRKATSMLELKVEQLLGEGDNRACYVHPEDPNLCVKIDKPWNQGLYNKRKNRIKKVFMPWLADISSNREEARFFVKKGKHLGEWFYCHAPRFYGIVLTNLGPGLVFDRVMDSDGRDSLYPDAYLRLFPDGLEHVLGLMDELQRFLLEHDLVVYAWNYFNFVIQRRDLHDRIVIVDWKTESRPNNDLPVSHICRPVARRKMNREIRELRQRLIRQFGAGSEEKG